MTFLDINSRPRSVGIFCLVLWAVIALSAVSAWGQGDTSYLEDIADLPLAPGLTEETGSGLVFDKPDGRIVEAVAAGAVEPDAVVEFYLGVLPALGWQLIERQTKAENEELIFEREDERFRIVIGKQAEHTDVRFELSPK